MKLTSIFVSTLTVAIVSAGMLACSGTSSSSGTSSGGSSGSVTGAGDCSKLAATMCGKFTTCFGSVFTSGVYGDTAACTTSLAADCTNSSTFPGSTFAVSGAKCEAALGASTCDDVIGGTNNTTLFDACGKGSLATAAACIDGAQCSSGFCEAKDSTSSTKCGACADLIAEGGKCTDSCGTPGLNCIAGKCAKDIALGGACGDSTAPCAGSAYCNSAKVCAARVAKGGACNADTQNCGLALFCGASGCEDVKAAKVGEACGIVNGAYVVCSGSNCNGSGVCETFAGKGEACGTGNSDKRCVQPYACIGGKCGFEDPSTCK